MSPAGRAGRRPRRVVVKLGSALLAGPRPTSYARVAAQLAGLGHTGTDAVVVSSGAIALGLGALGRAARPTALPLLQAAAAAGQPLLMRRWGTAFDRVGLGVAQVLLTHADLRDRGRFLNARRALGALLAAGVVPIVNENDSVATEEISMGDNDQLAAQVAALVDAELLVLLTDVDGLYDRDPHAPGRARRIAHVARPSHALALAGPSRGPLGTGGMRTKIAAAATASSRGVPTVICAGGRADALARAVAGDDIGTRVAPVARLRGRRHWIAFTLRPRGVLHVNARGAAAIVAGRSLPRTTVTRTEGRFGRGQMVDIRVDGRVAARGLAALGAQAMAVTAGAPRPGSGSGSGSGSGDDGGGGGDAVHRDDWVLLPEGA